MRGEVLGAERRRRWTAEQKARIVAESFGSGEPVSWVARRHDLSTSQLFAGKFATEGEILPLGGGGGPAVLTGKVDVLPAERADVA